jgi:hypothetical protein
MPESADFQTLFSQLQSRYPASSLTSELVQVQVDQYVVRAMVQVGGVTLATSLSAAANVELAEDQARLRVLKMLGIHSVAFREPEIHSAENGLSAGRSNYFLDPENSLSNSFPGSLDPASFEDTLPPSLPALDKIFRTSPAVPLPLDPPLSETVSEVPLTTPMGVLDPGVLEPEILEPGVLEPEILEPEPESSSEPFETTPIPEATPTSDRPAPVTPSRSSRSRKTGAVPEPPPSEPSLSEAPVSKPSLSEPSPPAPGEPLDLTPLFLQIEDEMDRIGWTKEQGRSHLKRAYNKRSRQQLTDEELVDFLAHLKTQSPVGEAG